VSDLSSLPVAPEFVEMLAENASETALEYLEKMGAPESVLSLIRSIGELHYYVTECYRHPEFMKRDRSDRFDIENVVIAGVNAVAECGGSFHGKYDYTLPRETGKAVRVRK
jgi:hypothetical protein